MANNVVPLRSRTADELPLSKVMEVLAQHRQGNRFIDSLCTQWSRGGTLSDKQADWAYKLAAERMAPAKAKGASTGNLPNLVALYDKLVAEEVRIARILDDGGRKLTISKAPSKPAYYVKVDGAYIATLPADGGLRPAAGSGSKDLPTIVKALGEASYDLLGAMCRFGVETGYCGRCGLMLTDPESVRIGLGPVCRGKKR